MPVHRLFTITTYKYNLFVGNESESSHCDNEDDLRSKALEPRRQPALFQCLDEEVKSRSVLRPSRV